MDKVVRLTLTRKYLKNSYTIGALYINDVYFCDTLEDRNRDVDKDGKLSGDETKVMHQTCIPFGVYKVIVSLSPKFNRLLPRLLNVPGFSGILIHRGNEAGHTSGCILVGENKQVGRLINSAEYEVEITRKLAEYQRKGYKTLIEIK